MRKSLDMVYLASGIAGALMLVMLLLMVLLQMFARWMELPVTGLTEIAGYCMAATSFFGLSYAFSRNSHIRVSLIVGQGTAGPRYPEIVALSAATLIAASFAWFAAKATILSYQFGEVSQGQDAIQTWIPQMVMCAGTVVFLVSIVSRLVCRILQPGTGGPSSQ